MTDEEFAMRQATAAAFFKEPITAWWIEHAPDCTRQREPRWCPCGAVLCFAGAKTLIRVDDLCGVEEYQKV